MSSNTIAINQQMDHFDGHHSVWVFGYGSLIYKADFPFMQRRAASITGWSRRFWQGSHDHRGTPAAPGRVVTLIPDEGAVCHGMAYLVSPDVFTHLDYREKNGYLRRVVDIAFEDGSGDMAEGVVYIAREDNDSFLGPASEADIALQIAGSFGPSGPNSDYLTQLAVALRELGRDDEHVFAIEQHLLELIASKDGR
ncbi:gamma-glutamylcyclotransferase [Pseudoduganella ginsengisoli]|uniref:glutathione-specific gamma-glutamylcyclotransferase n=1 Tax=Pseudoduganella ginsengisoli TaxID=1462440 RepID=A0A6L6PZD2_9BURK|nr:gamma-glutamylcyclotransferase [Pseudoduganella ginsengisoli]MTW02122.1 gamma-glutamylcyclotransferase [Pseudoduganella ginsengisoli]